jgi:hypothetical protein
MKYLSGIYHVCDQDLDVELIRDIVLYRWNYMSSIVFDVCITHIDIVNQVKPPSLDDLIRVRFESVGEKRTTIEDIIIDMSEYTCLSRQKKLKEIGI